jgi:hypothetical protein
VRAQHSVAAGHGILHASREFLVNAARHVDCLSQYFMKRLIAIAAFLTLGACEQVDQKVDCAKICNRYDECVDSDYDEAACRDSCEDRAANDDTFADKADACESCIDDRACSESFPCIDECIGIVP